MNYYEKTKNEFTAYVNTVVERSAINYREKVRKFEAEIPVADITSLPSVEELLSFDDSLFFMEKDITYANIENLFTEERHYRAMKKLSDREKQILFLTVIEQKKGDEVAEIMKMTAENVWQIKTRAIKSFLKNLSSEQ